MLSILTYLAPLQSDLHPFLVSSITTLGVGELRYMSGMNMLSYTFHTFLFHWWDVWPSDKVPLQVLSLIDT